MFTAVTSTVSFFAKHIGPVDDNASELTRGEETQLLTCLVRCNTRVVTAQSDVTGHCIRIMHNCQPVTAILNSVISIYNNLEMYRGDGSFSATVVRVLRSIYSRNCALFEESMKLCMDKH